MRRPFPCLGLVVLLLALAGTPAATRTGAAQAAGDEPWEVAESRMVSVDGKPAALSPDGAWLAGPGPADDFCIWDTETLDPTCEGEVGAVLATSITWAPDSTAVAFSLDAQRLFVDSDVYVFDVASGTLENLTDDGTETMDLFGESSEPSNVDLFPSWSPDSQHLAFARTLYGGDIENPGTTLMTIARDGGEPEEILILAPPYPMAISSTMTWLADESLLFSVWKADTGDGQNGIWRTSLADGGLDQVLPGAATDDVPLPIIVDVTGDATTASVVSLMRHYEQGPDDTAPVFFELDLAEGAPTPVDDLIAAASDARIITAPRFSPDGNALAFVRREGNGAYEVTVAPRDGGQATIIQTLDAPPTVEATERGVSWAEDGTIFVPTHEGGVLLTLPASTSASATPGVEAMGETPSADATWQVIDERHIDVDGIPLAFSPDGTWIAGVGPERDELCVWDVATLEPSCTDPLPVPIIHESIAWSPDGTAIAFSLDAPRILRDSDIYVFEVEHGTLENLTDDDPAGTGADRISIDRAEMDAPVPVDLYPAWSPDSQTLVFARTTWGAEEPGTTLMTIPRGGGEPEELFVLAPPEPFIIYSPMVWQRDGSILFSVWHADQENGQNGIWRLGADGGLDHLFRSAGSGVPVPLLADVTADGARASVVSMLSLGQFSLQPGTIFFDLDLETGEAVPWEEQLGLPLEPAETYRSDSPGVLGGPPTFSPDGDAVAFLTRTADDAVHLSLMEEDGIAREIVTVEPDPDSEPAMAGSQFIPRATWSDNGTLLVVSNAGIVLVALERSA